jgi:putative copper resistance protein D
VFVAIDSLVLALRALSFVAIFQAAGNAMFLAMFRSGLSAAAEQRIRTHARIAAVAGLVLAVLHYVLTPARMAGSFGGTFDPELEALLLESNAGGAHIVRVVGLALLLLSLDRATRLNSIAAAGGVALTIVSFALMGHTAIHPLRWALAPLLLVHVAVAAFWFGALSPLLVVARYEPPQSAGALVARFSRLALRAVPLIFVCGVLLAVLMIQSFAELGTPYGALVLAKGLAFGVLMALASLNKWRYGPRLNERAAGAASSFERTVIAEWALIAAVLAGTAVLTSLFAPEHLEGTFGPDHVEAPEHPTPDAGPGTR